MMTSMLHLQNLRMSNLDGNLRAIIPYFSMKCMAISPYALPATTTFAPLQQQQPILSNLTCLVTCSSKSALHAGCDALTDMPLWAT